MLVLYFLSSCIVFVVVSSLISTLHNVHQGVQLVYTDRWWSCTTCSVFPARSPARKNGWLVIAVATLNLDPSSMISGLSSELFPGQFSGEISSVCRMRWGRIPQENGGFIITPATNGIQKCKCFPQNVLKKHEKIHQQRYITVNQVRTSWKFLVFHTLLHPKRERIPYQGRASEIQPYDRCTSQLTVKSKVKLLCVVW